MKGNFVKLYIDIKNVCLYNVIRTNVLLRCERRFNNVNVCEVGGYESVRVSRNKGRED